MKKFMDKDFLLTTKTAKQLYHGYAEKCPIIDYHNHLSAEDIFRRKRYDNPARIWLAADHYKWRCMRAAGADEKYVTGDASDYDKFMRFANIMPGLIGNPVYHWTHLELKRYFGIDTPLTGETAEHIWQETSRMLTGEGFDTVSLLCRMNVRVLCTTDDPADDLRWHMAIAEADDIPFEVLPTFRPDRYLNIDHLSWHDAVLQLGGRYGKVTSWDSLLSALGKSLDFFCETGCRAADHGFICFRYEKGDGEAVFNKAMAGEKLTGEDIAVYRGSLLRFLAEEYYKRNLVMQLHTGAIRNNSPKLMATYGADAGADSIGETTDPFLISAFLGELEGSDSLPKTILYNLNPADSDMMATMAVNFAPKVQYGAAWWFNDHIRGIARQLDQLMETGLLSGTVGMLTDSRSVTSFVRHEYFRRILCEKIGHLVESGQYPCHMNTLGEMICDICWRNAKEYFGFEVQTDRW